MIIIPKQDLTSSPIGQSIDSVLEQMHDRAVREGVKLKLLCKEFANDSFGSKELYKCYVEKYRN